MIQPVPVGSAALDVAVLLYFNEAWTSAHLATVPLGDGQHALTATDAQAWASELVDYYLAMAHFTCCRLCLGLSLGIHGHDWTEQTGDHLWHFMGWFHALERVLTQGPQCETTTFVWDESSLKLHRDDAALTLYDQLVVARAEERGDRPTAWYPITLPLWAFVAQMNAAGTTYRALVDALRADLARRGCTPATMLPLLAGKGDLPHPAKDDLPLKLAIILREAGVALDPLDAVQRIYREHSQGLGAEG